MATITIPAPQVAGAAYNPSEPTRNTEEINRYLLDLFGTLSAAGFQLTDEIASLQEAAADEIAIQGAWEIQDSMIDLEISRLQTLLNVMNDAENLERFDAQEDGEARAIPVAFISAIAFLKKWKELIELGLLAYDLGTMAYDIYKRFWVEKEELRNLPSAIIDLIESTIKLLEKLKGLEMNRTNFEFRQQLMDNLAERIDDQMEVFRAGKLNAEPSTDDHGDIVQRLEDLQYNGEEFELLNGLKVSLHGRLVGG